MNRIIPLLLLGAALAGCYSEAKAPEKVEEAPVNAAAEARLNGKRPPRAPPPLPAGGSAFRSSSSGSRDAANYGSTASSLAGSLTSAIEDPMSAAPPSVSPFASSGSGSSGSALASPTPIAKSDQALVDHADPKAAKSTKTGPVTKKECESAVDHGMDLMLKTNPNLAKMPPDIIKTFKAQAMKDSSGSNPCAKKGGITRTTYDCSMAATTAAEFEKCKSQ